MKKILFIIILIIFSLFLYGKYIEVNNFKIREYTITNDGIPESFKDLKIVHFSDVLYKSNSNQNKLNDLVDTINNQNADIIIFSGDLFDSKETYNEDDYKFLEDILNRMDSTLFKFAVIGDNDEKYLDKYKDILYASNFILLDNSNKLLFYKDNTPINIIGITTPTDIDSLFETDVPYDYTLAITHKPDNLTVLSDYNINVILSGHSLGGIINVPYYGGIIKKDGSKTYINDYYKLDNTEIFISNGLGYENYEFRIFNTPSINIYRFTN